MDVVGLELLKGFGRLWLHPLTYLFFLTALWFGYRRVKRERKDFHTRVQDVIYDMTFPLMTSLVFGLVLSLIFSVVGIEIPYGMMVLLLVIWLLFLPFRNARFLSMTTVASIAAVVVIFLPEAGTGYALLDGWLGQLSRMNVVGIAWLIAVLFVAEALLILINGWKGTSPKLISSERGKTIGSHEMKRLWLLPILLVVPVGNMSFDGWWPLFSSTEGVSTGFMFVPFILGAQVAIQSDFPEKTIKKIGKQLLILSLVLLILAGLATVWAVIFPLVGIVGLISREIILAIHASKEKHRTSLYVKQKEGLTVLGVLPYSTADKMGVQVGETILKVNGEEVDSQSELYEALQLNSAYCKLEIRNRDGEVHFLQSSLYEGDHYQMGLLFVPDGEMNLSREGLRYSAVINKDRSVLKSDRKNSEPLESDSAHTSSGELTFNNSLESDHIDVEETEGIHETSELDEVIQQLEEDGKKENESSRGEVAVHDELAVPLTEENFQKELDAVKEQQRLEKVEDEEKIESIEKQEEKQKEEKIQEERRAETGDLPYGQAAGLEAFYDDFRKVAGQRETWSDMLEKQEDLEDEDKDEEKPSEEKGKRKE